MSRRWLAGAQLYSNAVALPAGNHTFRIQFGNKNREYIIHVPVGASTALPLLLAFHGGGGEAAGFQHYAGLDAVSDREKFFVVYPYGTGVFPQRLLTWNSGECCSYGMKNNVDDVGFAISVIDDVTRRTRVDTKRIYATGHSNGAMMSYWLAAEHAERIAAIVPVSGAYNLAKFAPSQPVAVLDMHSVDDPRALNNGGMGPAFRGTQERSLHRPVMVGIHRWTVNNKCGGDSTVTETRTGTAGTDNACQTATLLV
ncbi:MAG: PHB depolymerase family esterase [Gemmatimonadaceae bacterium]